MNLIARIRCLLGRHVHSRRSAVRYSDNSVLGRCKHCGTAMYRHPREGWQVERRSQQRCFERAETVRWNEAIGRRHDPKDPIGDQPDGAPD